MAEYINREETKRELSEWCISLNSPHLLSRDDTMFLLDNIPAADVAPVVHGRWIEQEKYNFGVMYDCSICGDRILDNGHSWNYCPNCGSRMDGDDDTKAD